MVEHGWAGVALTFVDLLRAGRMFRASSSWGALSLATGHGALAWNAVLQGSCCKRSEVYLSEDIGLHKG